MNKEDYIKDLYEEQIDKAMEELAEKYYRTPWSIKQAILTMMTDSDIALIIWEKKKEWIQLEFEKKDFIKWKRWNNRKILELLFLDEQEKINKLIKELNYILKSRKWDDWWFEDLQRAKETIPIADVIQIVSWTKITNSYRLVKCPLHKDKTASFKVYPKTNSFYCQWCKAGWSGIDFIKNYYNTSTNEAIKKFLSLYKR